jgi:hypothetical protein
MNGYDSASPIRMLQEVMTALDPNHVETKAPQRLD